MIILDLYAPPLCSNSSSAPAWHNSPSEIPLRVVVPAMRPLGPTQLFSPALVSSLVSSFHGVDTLSLVLLFLGDPPPSEALVLTHRFSIDQTGPMGHIENNP